MGHTTRPKHDRPPTTPQSALTFDVFEWANEVRDDAELADTTRQHIATIATFMMSSSNGEVWMRNDYPDPAASVPFSLRFAEEALDCERGALPAGQTPATVLAALVDLVTSGWLNLYCFAGSPDEPTRVEIVGGACRYQTCETPRDRGSLALSVRSVLRARASATERLEGIRMVVEAGFRLDQSSQCGSCGRKGFVSADGDEWVCLSCGGL